MMLSSEFPDPAEFSTPFRKLLNFHRLLLDLVPSSAKRKKQIQRSKSEHCTWSNRKVLAQQDYRGLGQVKVYNI